MRITVMWLWNSKLFFVSFIVWLKFMQNFIISAMKTLSKAALGQCT